MKSVQMALENITPKRARELLDRNPSNRPIRKRWVARLAKIIRDGEWQVNAETIKVNCNGDLVDGQHRLQAIIDSGTTVRTWVAYNVPQEAFHTIDQGHSRTLADVLARNDEANYVKLGAAIRWIKLLYSKNPGRKRETVEPHEAMEILRKYPGLRDSVSYGTSAAASRLLSQSLVGALHFMFSRKDKELATAFFDRIGDGDGLTRQQPLWRLRDRLIKLKADQAVLPHEVIAAYVIKTWNATRENQQIGILKFMDGEQMPAIK